MIKAPDYVENLKPYVPGKPVEDLERELGIKDSVKLASNENPLGPSPTAIEEMKKHLKGIHRYPDGGGYYLKKALHEMHHIDTEEVIIGNGSNELIDIAVRTFLTPQDEAIMADPSFVVYPMSVTAAGCSAIKVPLKDMRHDLHGMANVITERTKIIFIANPNNPTGTIVRADEFADFMKSVPDDILVVMDEAYYEYVTDKEYPNSFNYFRKGRDILILRTFSKIYGLAGLRIGYGIANKAIIEQMNKIRAPFNSSSLAQAAALGAIKDVDHLRKSLFLNEDGKNYLYVQLKTMGIDFVKTEANFIYIDLKQHAMEVYHKLLKKGIIVRPVGENTIRLTIGLREENEKFIKKLREVL